MGSEVLADYTIPMHTGMANWGTKSLMHLLSMDIYDFFCYTVVCKATDQKLWSDTNSEVRFRTVSIPENEKC